MNRCEICGNEVDGRFFSIFDVKIICSSCSQKEEQIEGYETVNGIRGILKYSVDFPGLLYLQNNPFSHFHFFVHTYQKENKKALQFFNLLENDVLAKEYKKDCFVFACLCNNHELVKELLEKEKEVRDMIHKQYKYEESIMEIMVKKGFLEVVKILYKYGSSIHIKNRFEENLLFLAAGSGNARLAMFLIEQGVSVSEENHLYVKPLKRLITDLKHTNFVQMSLDRQELFTKEEIDYVKQYRLQSILS